MKEYGPIDIDIDIDIDNCELSQCNTIIINNPSRMMAIPVFKRRRNDLFQDAQSAWQSIKTLAANFDFIDSPF